MKIQELETQSGLDRATIRYYEKQQLLSPVRLENGYRDYSDDDLRMLLKIKLLRRLGVSLETIKVLQQGSGGLQDILPEQIRQLQQKIATMERAVEVCKNMQSDGVVFDSLDASLYLKMLEEQTRPASFYFREENIKREYHPVLRYVARITDYLLVRMALQVLFIVLLRIRPYGDFLKNLVVYGAPFLSVPLTAWMLSAWGTTPGKWLMGIRVEASPGVLLTYQDALHREWNVLRYGYGFGIPFYELWRLYVSYRDYGKYDDLPWESGRQSQRFNWNSLKKAAFAVFCFVYILTTGLIAVDRVMPKYRGDVTVAQFSENYNFYANILEMGTTLNSDGTWKVVQLPENAVVISLGNKAENKNANFVYETEGERITRISYQNAWQEVMMLSPIDKEIIAVCFTALCSQERIGIVELSKFVTKMQNSMVEPSGQIQYKNLEVCWNIDAENCYHRDGVYYTKDKEKPSRVAFEFEIIIH